MSNGTDSLIVCPPWCQTDHEQELSDTIGRDGRLHGLLVTTGHRAPDEPTSVEYTPVHRQILGSVTVACGTGDTRGQVDVVLDRVDDLQPRVLLLHPDDWTEDYDARAARDLAALLLQAADVLALTEGAAL